MTEPPYKVVRHEWGNGHGYTIEPDIGRVPGVTTITGVVIPKPWLGPWQAKETGLGLLELAKRYPDEDVLKGRDWNTLRDWLKREKLRAEDKRDAAGDKGTATHNAAEAWVREGKLPDPEAAIPSDRPYVASLRAFLETVKPKVKRTEVPIGSAKHRYAGTVDLLGVSGRLPLASGETVDVENAILDYKTSKSVVGNYKTGELKDDMRLQLRGYAVAAEEMGAPPADGLYVVHLTKSGFKVYDAAHYTDEDWIAAVEWYHAYKQTAQEQAQVAA